MKGGGWRDGKKGGLGRKGDGYMYLAGSFVLGGWVERWMVGKRGGFAFSTLLFLLSSSFFFFFERVISSMPVWNECGF